jgi:hypothetical protein
MKIGTHNLGPNAFAQATIVKAEAGALIIRQIGSGGEQKVILSANQIALLKDVLP